MWKFGTFLVTQILREMNFSDLGGQKFAFMAGLTLLDFSFGEVWHIVKAKI